ncbi:MAG: hypothetical protein ACJ789_20145 [Thermomicrobiales bacterium]
MINLTNLDLVLMDHTTRVARVDREGWLREATAPTGSNRAPKLTTFVGSLRRHLGGALVGVGEHLRGTPAAHAAHPAAAPRYTPDAVR